MSHHSDWILPLQVWRPCGSFPRKWLHLAERRNPSRQTPGQCWQILQNLLHSSEKQMRKASDFILWLNMTVLFWGSCDYHEISVGDVMFDETSSENDHPCGLSKHRLAVQTPNIWSMQNDHKCHCRIISTLHWSHILSDSPSTMSSTRPGFLYEWK